MLDRLSPLPQSGGLPKAAAWGLAITLAVVLECQAAPDAGDLLRQRREDRTPVPETTERAPLGLIPPLPARRAPAAQGTKFHLRAVVVKDAEGLLAPAAIQRLTQPYTGRPVSISELQDMVAGITQALATQGWVLARAQLPPQDVSDGNVVVTVQRGRLAGGPQGDGIQLEVDPAVRVPALRLREVVRQAVGAARPGELSEQSAERAVLLLNEWPGVRTQAELSAGPDANTSTLLMKVQHTSRFDGSAGVDNLGNRYTGQVGTSASFNVQDVLGLGEQVGASALASSGLQLLSLAGSTALGNSGVRAQVGHTALRYEVGEELARLGLKGQASTTQLSLSYPLVLHRRLALRVSAGAEHKALADESLGITVRDRRIDLVSVGVYANTVDAWVGGGLSSMNWRVTQGRADLSRVQSDVQADALLGSAGRFQKVNLQLARMQRLGEQTALIASLSSQWSTRNLPSSERMSIGGPSGVRAYPVGEAAADQGSVLTLEWRQDWSHAMLPAPLRSTLFLDHARVRLLHTPNELTLANATGRNAFSLSGAGIGFSMPIAPWALLKMEWARQIGENPGRSARDGNNSDGRADRSRLLLSLSSSFLAW